MIATMNKIQQKKLPNVQCIMAVYSGKKAAYHYKIDFPILYDPSHAVKNTYDIQVWPTLLYINQDSKIESSIYGARSERVILNKIQH